MITVTGLGTTGFAPDQLPQELADSALTDVLNARTRDGNIERIGGDTAIYTTPSVIPYFTTIYANGSTTYCVYCGNSKVYVDDGLTVTEITGSALTGTGRWTGGTLNGILVLNNAKEVPAYWAGDTAANLVTLTGWDTNWTCAAMRPWKNYLFALDITKTSVRYPHMVKWSSAADPGAVPASWDEADPAVDAGELDLAETTDFLVDCLPLGDQLMIYKQFSTYACTYVGGQFIFSFRRIPGESGMLARGCAAAIPDGHVVLTNGDVVLMTQQGAKSIVSGRVRRWLFNTIDSTYSNRSFVVANPTFNEVWICYPTAGNSTCNRALIWNWKEDTFVVRELNNVTYGCAGPISFATADAFDTDALTFDESSTSFDQDSLPATKPQLILTTTDPKILAIDVGNDFHGTGFTSRIERLGLAFGDAATVKTVRAVYPRIDGNIGSTIYIQIGSSMDVEAGYQWSDPMAYTIGSSYKVDCFVSGRFFAYRIYSTASYTWRAKSLDFDVVGRGRY